MSSTEPLGTRGPTWRTNRAQPILAVVVASLMSTAWSAAAEAQQPAQGFAVERLYLSAPGSGWLVMDDLNMQGGLGGAVALTTSDARQPLELTSADGAHRLSVVSDEAFVEVGLAVTYRRYRAYLTLPAPLVVSGTSGTLGGYQFSAPIVNLGTNPDTVFDPSVGLEARVLGEPEGRFRLGFDAQLIVPSGSRADYLTDGTARGIVRGLVAGDLGHLSYVGQLGVQVRPLDDSPTPGSPHGSEMLFGAGLGRRISIAPNREVVIGPEFFGDTALQSVFGGGTGFEGMLTARFERTGAEPHIRVKLGVGAGLDQNSGTPHWRVVAGVELVGQRSGSAEAAK